MVNIFQRARVESNGQPDASQSRLRRLRRTETLRAMMCETRLTPDDFILPLFVEEGLEARAPVKSMPGVWRETEKSVVDAVKAARAEGIKAVMLFGVSRKKDSIGSDALKRDGLLDRMVDRVKTACPEVTVIADLCFCEYTDHGHCGVLDDSGDVANDLTLENLQLQALVAARAGADMIAPSGMMDGSVAALRSALDGGGFSHLPIMSYSTKFASSFYGPFRDAAGCSLGKGNRKTYQMNPANGREAIRESLIDEAEGADILMVKPGMAYLDVLARLRDQTRLPLAVYQVSGEYAMIRFAAEAGALDASAVMMESLLAFKRAGADLILSYFAVDAARVLQDVR
jgi:porphobilinogen synthase